MTVDNGALADFDVVTDEITSPYTGGTKHAQGVKLLSGTANAADVIPGDATNGLDVDVTRLPKSGTATLSNVAGSASSVTLLSAAAGRLGATIVNDSTAVLYVKFGTTASSTSYTVKLVADAYYEVPFGYTGRIDGIWASATGNARVTELTA